MYVDSASDSMIPDWLRDNINHVCVCGSSLLNYYNDNGKCTNRVCSNKYCYESLSRKLLFCVESLGLKGTGIGIAKCRELIKSHDATSHFQAFPYLFENKPKCTVSLYLKLCCIHGMDNRWGVEAEGYSTVEEFLSKYNGRYRNIVDENINLIRDNASYVDITPVEELNNDPVVTGNIMITGDLIGIPKRELFTYALRKATDGLVSLTLVGKRKTDVMALIKEDSSPITDKVRVAREAGIPIFNSSSFIEYVYKLAQERKGRNDNT